MRQKKCENCGKLIIEICECNENTISDVILDKKGNVKKFVNERRLRNYK